jgi:hypothetical protein
MTEGEKSLYRYKNCKSGDFMKSLFDTIFLADNYNFNKLSRAYPEECVAVFRFRRQAGYWDKLSDEYKKVYG